MIPHYTKIHNRFTLNAIHYSRDELNDIAYSFIKEGVYFEKSIGNFLLDWLDEKDTVTVSTSGSTGTPKAIKIKKQSMVHSAITTGNYFNLQPGDTALHCLPTNFIAGKMMLVRAMILGLQLTIVEPISKPPFDEEKKYSFCAMVPLQVQKSLQRLHNIRNLIIGGAKISKPLKVKLQELNLNAFETYGMTETITHIAIKPIHKQKDNLFKTLPDILITQDTRECLVIEAPHLFNKPIITNDIVKLHSKTTFELLGRLDNVINSGGIKLYPEQIEEKLAPYINDRYFITSEDDDHLGERAVLVVESDKEFLDTTKLFNLLDKFETPKMVYYTSKFLETDTGKVKRQETLHQIKK